MPDDELESTPISTSALPLPLPSTVLPPTAASSLVKPSSHNSLEEPLSPSFSSFESSSLFEEPSPETSPSLSFSPFPVVIEMSPVEEVIVKEMDEQDFAPPHLVVVDTINCSEAKEEKSATRIASEIFANTVMNVDNTCQEVDEETAMKASIQAHLQVLIKKREEEELAFIKSQPLFPPRLSFEGNRTSLPTNDKDGRRLTATERYLMLRANSINVCLFFSFLYFGWTY